MKLLPLRSTSNGIAGNNDKLYPDFTDSYRAKLKEFYSRYLDRLNALNPDKLNSSNQLSYDILKRELQVMLNGLSLDLFPGPYPTHRYMPFNQFSSVPLYLGQLGSGTGAQPFKTVQDYNDWMKRASAFSEWSDSAIVYFRKGINAGIVLPEPLVVKMIPQMDALVTDDVTKSIFYGPVKLLPQNFTAQEKKTITDNYKILIKNEIIPSYKKLSVFLKEDYLPHARKSHGLSALNDGKNAYRFLIRYYTTTSKTPEEIYNTGLAEVKRIRIAMDSVKEAVGFRGDLDAFFNYLRTDSRFMPFKTPEEVLNSFRSVESKIAPNLKKMFNKVPKTPFEIRQTEAFRAASSSAQYNQGRPDGSRPGIFYVPIIDATKYNVTTGMEGLFLHEAIPGHHYQISLQNENTSLPEFRRFLVYSAHAEGWGLYAESLGKELGVYTDPYQYFGALAKEMHRSVRLVVDVGLHEKGMTREEAIRYMMGNMSIDERGATAEIERYMAIPGQALSYKIGQLKLIELRTKFENELGNKFNLSSFHDEILDGGSMALETLEQRLNKWAEEQGR